MLPGALRLLRHLQATGVPLALATSSNRANLTKKLSGHAHVHAAFQTTCCGDEVCVCGPSGAGLGAGGWAVDVAAGVRRVEIISSSTPMPSDLENQRNSQHLRQTLSLLTMQVERGKPAPDCFLAAAEKLGLPPESCLAIEDSRPGVQAALAAGMHVVVVPSAVRCCGQVIESSTHLPLCCGSPMLPCARR